MAAGLNALRQLRVVIPLKPHDRPAEIDEGCKQRMYEEYLHRYAEVLGATPGAKVLELLRRSLLPMESVKMTPAWRSRGNKTDAVQVAPAVQEATAKYRNKAPGRWDATPRDLLLRRHALAKPAGSSAPATIESRTVSQPAEQTRQKSTRVDAESEFCFPFFVRASKLPLPSAPDKFASRELRELSLNNVSALLEAFVSSFPLERTMFSERDLSLFCSLLAEPALNNLATLVCHLVRTSHAEADERLILFSIQKLRAVLELQMRQWSHFSVLHLPLLMDALFCCAFLTTRCGVPQLLDAIERIFNPTAAPSSAWKQVSTENRARRPWAASPRKLLHAHSDLFEAAFAKTSDLTQSQRLALAELNRKRIAACARPLRGLPLPPPR